MKTKLKLAAAGSAAAVMFVGFSGAGAEAAKLITGAQIKNETITGRDIKNGSIAAKELSPGIQQRLADVKKLKNGVNGKNGADGKDGRDGVDGENFELTYVNTFADKTITHIGGSFAQRATEIGTFDLEAGKYLVQTDALFTHNGATPTAAPSLQAALRVPDDSQWGLDVGTVFATLPGATVHEREAQGTSLRVIELAAPQTVTVYGFGYNADGSAAGSGGFDAKVTVVVQKVN